MKLVFAIIILIISPVVTQISFESNSTIDESGSYKIHCTSTLTDQYPIIAYHIINGSMTNFDIHNTNDDLTMSITNSSNAVLTLDIPITFLDAAKYALGFDAQTDDGRVVPMSTQRNPNDNILLMHLPSGNNNLIIGTAGVPEDVEASTKNCIILSKVPEFGSLVLLIASIGIIGLVLIQKRFRF